MAVNAQIFQKCGQKVQSVIIVVRDAVKLSIVRGTYGPCRVPDSSMHMDSVLSLTASSQMLIVWILCTLYFRVQ